MRNPFAAPSIRGMFLRAGGRPPSDEEFFDYIRLPNGTFKTTRSGRLCDVDELLVQHLPSTTRTIDVLDVGVSSGTLTAELDERLSANGILHATYGSDVCLEAQCLRLFPWTVLFMEPRMLLQVDVFGLAFPNTPPSRLSALIFSMAKCVLSIGRRLPWCLRSIPLLSATARQSSVLFCSGDVFGDVHSRDPEMRFDVVRVANLLNRSYFSDERIRAAVANLSRSLREGGLLVVARTEAETNDCTIFRKDDSRLSPVASLHGGVDIAALVAKTDAHERESSPRG